MASVVAFSGTFSDIALDLMITAITTCAEERRGISPSLFFPHSFFLPDGTFLPLSDCGIKKDVT